VSTTKNRIIAERAQDYYDGLFDNETQALLDKAEGGNEYACEQLQEMPLAITKYATYFQEGTTEWHVELAWGGPAARLIIGVSADGDMAGARFEFQDWFTPWTPAPQQDEDLLKRFAYMVGYYHD
jgi:hypothetical protein